MWKNVSDSSRTRLHFIKTGSIGPKFAVRGEEKGGIIALNFRMFCMLSESYILGGLAARSRLPQSSFIQEVVIVLIVFLHHY